MKLIYQFLIVVEKVLIVFYSRIKTITRADELRHSPAARDTKSSSQVANIICSLNNILLILQTNVE
jgi:hypothetical protein